MFSRLNFASLAVFSPRGQSEVSERSRRLRDAVKAGRRDVFERAAVRVQSESDMFRQIFESCPVLIPVPGSSPRIRGALWVPERIAEAFCAAGLGSSVVSCLERIEAVPKSAFSPPGERPSVARHLKTLEVMGSVGDYEDLLLIDDVVTRGRTLFAAATVLKGAFPKANISGFALLRAMGLVPEVDAIVSPCMGHIRRIGSDVDRRP